MESAFQSVPGLRGRSLRVIRDGGLSTVRPYGVTKGDFLGVTWAGTVLTFFLVVGRIYTRIKVHRRVCGDDFLVVFAWILLLINAFIYQSVADFFYETSELTAGIIPLPPNYPADLEKYLKTLVPLVTFFYAGLWSIKFAFLVFFRRLGNQVRGQKIHWWVVSVLTATTWLVTWGTQQYKCTLSSFEYIFENCHTDSAVKFQWDTLYLNTAMDVVTDVAIITIPIHLLWNVRISIRQKLALMAIFSLTVFIIAFAIIRATLVTTYSSAPDLTWLFTWSSIEQFVSILIACLASFRALFTKQENSPRPQSTQFLSRQTGVFWSPKSWFSRASSTSVIRRNRQPKNTTELPGDNPPSETVRNSTTNREPGIVENTVTIISKNTLVNYRAPPIRDLRERLSSGETEREVDDEITEAEV